MKIILTILIITLTTLNAEKKHPTWIEKDPDTNAKYFRGISTWYSMDDYRMKELANKDAINSAFMSLGNYFGMNIKSELSIQKRTTSFSSSTKIDKKIKTKSNQLLFDIKPYKTYKELSKNEQHFKIYMLLKLDSMTEAKIKAKLKQDENEFLELKQKILTSINNKDFYKAQNFLELAKGKRTAYMDDTIITLEKRLKELKDGLLTATISLNKIQYMPEEDIELEVSINQKGYLYIFYDTGDDIEMLFPNKFNRKAKLKSNDMVSFPTDDISLQTYEESLDKDTKIFAIASKINLNIFRDSIDKVDGIYIYEKDGKQNKKIDRCINQGECTKSEVNFKVSNQSDTKIKIKYQCSNNMAKEIKNIFLTKGIKSQDSDKKIVLNIKKQSKYSSLMESHIDTYKIKIKLYINNNLKKEENIEIDKNDLEEEIINLYYNMTI